MTKTNVPTVVPMAEVCLQLGKLLELAHEYYKMTGDKILLREAVGEIRGWYEQEFKAAANLGHMDRDLVNSMRLLLETMDAKYGL